MNGLQVDNVLVLADALGAPDHILNHILPALLAVFPVVTVRTDAQLDSHGRS